MDLGIKLTVRHAPSPKDPVDVSVIIAHRGPEMGLWMTLESCEADLKESGLSYEYIVVVNGEEKLSEDLRLQRHWLETSGNLGAFIHRPEALSPPAARQIGSWSATGKYLFFFDNHCMVDRPYFSRAVETMKLYGIGMLHSTTRFWLAETAYYEYKMSFKRNFWVDRAYSDPLSPNDPYQVAVAGHGAFAVTRELWDKVEGYWMGFNGYAGEEPYFDLKCWRLGTEVWIDPQMVHRHWSGKRPYNRHFTDDYIKNLLMAANIIGGERWMYDVGDNMMRSTRLLPGGGVQPTPFIDLLEEAYKRSSERAAWVTEHSVRTLDECFEHFQEAGIRF